MVLAHVFQAEFLEKHPSAGVHMVYYSYGNWKRKWIRIWKGKVTSINILFMKNNGK